MYLKEIKFLHDFKKIQAKEDFQYYSQIYIRNQPYFIVYYSKVYGINYIVRYVSYNDLLTYIQNIIRYKNIFRKILRDKNMKFLSKKIKELYDYISSLFIFTPYHILDELYSYMNAIEFKLEDNSNFDIIHCLNKYILYIRNKIQLI